MLSLNIRTVKQKIKSFVQRFTIFSYIKDEMNQNKIYQ